MRSCVYWSSRRSACYSVCAKSKVSVVKQLCRAYEEGDQVTSLKNRPFRNTHFVNLLRARRTLQGAAWRRDAGGPLIFSSVPARERSRRMAGMDPWGRALIGEGTHVIVYVTCSDGQRIRKIESVTYVLGIESSRRGRKKPAGNVERGSSSIVHCHCQTKKVLLLGCNDTYTNFCRIRKMKKSSQGRPCCYIISPGSALTQKCSLRGKVQSTSSEQPLNRYSALSTSGLLVTPRDYQIEHMQHPSLAISTGYTYRTCI